MTGISSIDNIVYKKQKHHKLAQCTKACQYRSKINGKQTLYLYVDLSVPPLHFAPPQLPKTHIKHHIINCNPTILISNYECKRSHQKKSNQLKSYIYTLKCSIIFSILCCAFIVFNFCEI
jgi:hypothetical protein